MDEVTLKGIIREFGDTADGPMKITAVEDGGWTLWWDDMEILSTEWADAPPRLVSTIPLGRVAPTRRLAVYEAMLTYNLLWRQTGGARLGLGGPEGEATLIHEIEAEHITVPALGAALGKACRIAGAWRRFVLERTSDELMSPMPPPSLLA